LRPRRLSDCEEARHEETDAIWARLAEVVDTALA